MASTLRSETIVSVERRTLRKSIRIAAGIIGIFDGIAWLLLVATYFWSQGEPATRGLDEGAAIVTTILFALTGAPALVLVARNRAPLTAVALALAFPTVFLALLLAVAYVLP